MPTRPRIDLAGYHHIINRGVNRWIQPLWCNTNEAYRNQDVINRAMKSICEKVGLKVGTLHDLRRSFNTIMKQYGFQPDFILQMIGNTKDVNAEHYKLTCRNSINLLFKFT